MIHSIRFENFKGLSGETVNFGDLTLLTGANAVGKSSVLQAILLSKLAQSTGSGLVDLNSDFGLVLGQASDVLTHGRSDSEITFHFGFDSRSIDVVFGVPEGKRFLQLLSPKTDLSPLGESMLGDFCYLSAERQGPEESYEFPSTAPELLQIGYRGENTAAVLSVHERLPILEQLEHPTASNLRLTKQVEAWLAELAPGTRLQVQSDPSLGRVAIRFSTADLSSEWMHPGNYGFGLTYCLPIIVACLVAKPGALILIDSPEAHLHASAQSSIGRFLARVACAGVQVVVETQSDHVLNGVRLASLQQGSSPPRNRVMINHFSRQAGPKIVQIGIRDNGDLSDRPLDFFDQTERDLSKIVESRFGKVVAGS